MKFDLKKSIEILESTPYVLKEMLSGLSSAWTMSREGKNTWSPYEVVGHLIHGEKTDWIPRMKIILHESSNKNFEPFDRFAQFKESKGKSMNDLLATFKKLRQKNIRILKSVELSGKTLNLKGIHPDFGSVTLKQLLASWVVHDLDHIAQISRVIAKQYAHEAEPWKTYLPILTK